MEDTQLVRETGPPHSLSVIARTAGSSTDTVDTGSHNLIDTNTSLMDSTNTNAPVTHSTDTNTKGEREAKQSDTRDSKRLSSSPCPTSTADLRSHLDHVPEMNLPWQPLSSVTHCSCGRAFTYLVSKVTYENHDPPLSLPPPYIPLPPSPIQYHCCYCGTVSCDTCARSHAPLPWHASQRPHRVCRPCHKLMRRRQELENTNS